MTNGHGVMDRSITTALLAMLLLALVAGCASRAGSADALRASQLRQKPWQEWSAEEVRWGLGHYDEVFASRVVRAGAPVHALPPGRPIAGLAEGTDGGKALDDYLVQQRVAGLLVLQDGRVRLERYAKGRSASDRWTSQSVGKSVTSTLVGIALQEGAIDSLDDPVSRYIAGLRGSAYDDVTVRQLLTMTSGVRWTEDYTDLGSDLARLYATPPAPGMSVATSYMRTLGRATAPGERWVYKTGETHLLGDLVRSATGRDLADYLSEKIWRPYGMEAPASWTLDGSGAELAGCCLQATLRDFGRFGQFILDGGRIGDSDILGEAWIADATRAQVVINDAGDGYGYQWWTHPDGSFSAFGIHGQMIHLDPGRRLVVVLNSAWPEALDRERSQARWRFLGRIKSAIDVEG